MADDATATLEARDGTPLPVPSGAGRPLAELLANPSIRGYLVRHGLEIERRDEHLRVELGSLRRALHHLPEALDDAPPAVLDHPALSGDGSRRLLGLLGGMPGDPLETAVVLVPVTPRPCLEVVPEPEEPRDVLLAMDQVDPHRAPDLLRALDGMLDRLSLRRNLLADALIPLLRDDDSCGLAARILGRSGAVEAVGPLEHALSRTGSLDSRLEILGALMRLGHRALGIRTLRSILIHGSETARARAVRTLEEIAVASDADALHDMMRLAPRVERLGLAAMLYRLGDMRAYQVLARAITELDATTSARLTTATLDGAETTGTRRFIPLLEAYVRREERPWFRARGRAILERLRRRGATEAAPERLLQRAEVTYFSNRREEAMELLTELLTLLPGHAQALYLKANCLKEEGRVQEALRAAGRALANDPSNWRLHRLRGSLLWDGGQHDDALEAYDRALRLQPTDPYTWYYKGYVLYRLQRFEAALPCLDRALSLKSDSPYIYNQKAFCLERLDRHEEAVRCYRRSLRLDPGDLFTREYMGQALQAAGRLREALACFEAVLEAAPRREESLYRRADVLYDMDRWSNSEEAFSAYLDVRPDCYNAWFNRGLCLRFLARWDEAADCFAHALRVRPDSTNARRHLSYCAGR
ncbi:MAG: tetratricopeptide repeat protein [Myxococcota bacterium]